MADTAARLELGDGELHVIIDEQYVPEFDEKLVCQDIDAIRVLTDALEPTTVTLLSGGTPRKRSYDSLQVRTRPELALWAAVHDAVLDSDGLDLAYGDYGTVHPLPLLDPGRIRAPHPYFYYTASRSSLFLAIRGGNVPSELCESPQAAAFTAVADVITDRDEFRGPSYSWGDHELARARSDGPLRAGQPAYWVAMATSHHLTHLVSTEPMAV